MQESTSVRAHLSILLTLFVKWSLRKCALLVCKPLVKHGFIIITADFNWWYKWYAMHYVYHLIYHFI
jgi:hypothetical protein